MYYKEIENDELAKKIIKELENNNDYTIQEKNFIINLLKRKHYISDFTHEELSSLKKFYAEDESKIQLAVIAVNKSVPIGEFYDKGIPYYVSLELFLGILKGIDLIPYKECLEQRQLEILRLKYNDFKNAGLLERVPETETFYFEDFFKKIECLKFDCVDDYLEVFIADIYIESFKNKDFKKFNALIKELKKYKKITMNIFKEAEENCHIN